MARSENEPAFKSKAKKTVQVPLSTKNLERTQAWADEENTSLPEILRRNNALALKLREYLGQGYFLTRDSEKGEPAPLKIPLDLIT